MPIPSIENDTLSAVLEDAAVRLEAVRRWILVGAQSASPTTDFETPFAAVKELKEQLSRFELGELDAIVESLFRQFRALSDNKTPPSSERSRFLLDLIACAEAKLAETRLATEDNPLDLAVFVDRSFDRLFANAEPTSKPDIAENEFEIDTEMLEIFSLEAEELLRNIDANLLLLSGDPSVTDALWEIRRSAHTLKGAAGIVGLKSASELAHRVEDLLDKLSESNAEGNPRILSLLTSASECLQALTAGENTKQLADTLEALYAEFEDVSNTFESDQAAAPIDEIAHEPAGITYTETSITAQPEALPKEKASAEARGRPIVRVSLNRLDDLVRNVRELVMSRSVFEQHLADLERQIEDLHNSTRRLRSLSAKLEIEFEARMLGSANISKASGRMLPASDGFDPLEFDEYTEFHQATRELGETASDTFAINAALDRLRSDLETLFVRQKRSIEEMQGRLMSIRMVEFGTLTTRLQRAVRVTCDEENKKCDLVIENEKLELDTQILDALIEPLMHLIKNAVVHGIESSETRRLLGKPEVGRIRLKVSSEDTHIVVSLSDDGNGIAGKTLLEKAVNAGLITPARAARLDDEKLLELIFLPGLTTAEKLNLSAGRGVGMSIVKESIEAGKGTISIESVPQHGTTFIIRLPVPLAVTNALLVRASGKTYAVPVKSIKHVTEVDQPEQNGILDFNGDGYSVAYLSELVGDQFAAPSVRSVRPVLLIETAGKKTAVVVDEVRRSEEVVIRSLGKPLDSIKGILGVTPLGNGDLVPILDMQILLTRRSKPAQNNQRVPVKSTSVMIVDDSPSVRHTTGKLIRSAGYLVTTAKDGVEALELLKASPLPDIIISDIEMPRMDGYEFVRSLRSFADWADIPVIFVTSRAGAKHREKAVELGVEDYLVKPFDEVELVNALKRRLVEPSPSLSPAAG